MIRENELKGGSEYICPEIVHTSQTTSKNGEETPNVELEPRSPNVPLWSCAMSSLFDGT